MRIPIVLFVAACVAFILFSMWGRKPHKHREVSLADLEGFFEVLLRRGGNGGFMMIEIPRTSLFVQFSKYILNGGLIGLQFDFPLAPWSEMYYEPLKQELQEGGLHYTVEPGREGGGVREFLTVDIGQDVRAAAGIARTVSTKVFRLREDLTVTVWFSNVSPREETITRKAVAENKRVTH
jgi:hypothetical protein